MQNPISRRRFVQWMSTAVAAATTVGTRSYAEENITALQVVARIQAKLATQGVAWRSSHFDRLPLGRSQYSGRQELRPPSNQVWTCCNGRRRSRKTLSSATNRRSGTASTDPGNDNHPVHEAKSSSAKEHQMWYGGSTITGTGSSPTRSSWAWRESWIGFPTMTRHLARSLRHSGDILRAGSPPHTNQAKYFERSGGARSNSPG